MGTVQESMTVDRRRWARVAACLAAVAVAAGCGSDGDDTTSTTDPLVEAGQKELEKSQKIKTPIDASDVVKVLPPPIVTDGDVVAEKKGSPERAFLEWWQAWQWRDEVTVLDLTSKNALDSVGGEDTMLDLIALNPLGGVEVTDVNESGNTALINAGLLNFQPPGPNKPPPSKPTSSQPVTFAMVKEDGEWRYDDVEYLELRLNALEQAQGAQNQN